MKLTAGPATAAGADAIAAAATVTASIETRINTTDDAAGVATSVVTSADLSIVKTSSASEVLAGAGLTYRITVTNRGPSDAQSVSWSDPLPPFTTFVSNSGAAGWSCTNPALGGTGNVGCNIATLPTGASAVFTVSVGVDAAAPLGTTITNTATATSLTPDPVATNNNSVASALVKIVGTAIAPSPFPATFGPANDLIVGGSETGDNISLVAATGNFVTVNINGVNYGTFAPSARMIGNALGRCNARQNQIG